MDERQRERLIQEHLEAIRRLEAARAVPAESAWPPKGYYLLWHVVVGMMLGVIGAGASLLANVVGAPIFGQPPLQLIRVFLTFPMGERALHAEEGLVLFVGCVLYFLTGVLYGIAFHLVMSVWFSDAPGGRRFAVATGLGLGLWLVNFYLILSWLQPFLLGGNWIVRLVPSWVAALTHLVFVWTMLAAEQWGRFVPPVASPTTLAALVLLAHGVGGCRPVAAQASESAAGAAVPKVASPADAQPPDLDEWHTLEPGEYLGYNRRTRIVQRGKGVYEKYCVGCHGVAGDGKGPAAVRLLTQPRDFRSGVYKFRSTDSSSLPLEADLHRTITRGLGGGVSMPSFPFMPERDKIAVIEYLKRFYPRWEERKGERIVVPLPAAPDDIDDPARAERGRVVFLAMQCFTCHGVFGTDVRAEQTEFVDSWGNQQKAFDFTRGTLKGGDAPEDIYRTFHTGLRSIMPAYSGPTLASVTGEGYEAQKHLLPSEVQQRLAPFVAQFPATSADLYTGRTEAERTELAERNSWDLVAYVMSLRKSHTTARAVLGEQP